MSVHLVGCSSVLHGKNFNFLFCFVQFCVVLFYFVCLFVFAFMFILYPWSLQGYTLSLYFHLPSQASGQQNYLLEDVLNLPKYNLCPNQNLNQYRQKYSSAQKLLRLPLCDQFINVSHSVKSCDTFFRGHLHQKSLKSTNLSAVTHLGLYFYFWLTICTCQAWQGIWKLWLLKSLNFLAQGIRPTSYLEICLY